MWATLWSSYANKEIPIITLWFCRQGFLFDFTPQLVRNSSFIGYLCKGPKYINIWNLTQFQTTILEGAKKKKADVLNQIPSIITYEWLIKLGMFRELFGTSLIWVVPGNSSSNGLEVTANYTWLLLFWSEVITRMSA